MKRALFWARPQLEWLVLGVLLALGLIHGLTYVFLVPPWQHYDEPSHFEVVWLIADRWEVPEPGDENWEMRRRVLASMVANGFFRDMGFTPDPDAPGVPHWQKAYDQLSEPPLYYLLAAAPIIALDLQDLLVQLYAARLVSVGLYLITILAAYGTTRELTPAGHALRLLVPFSVAALPGFTDVMTSVNNDVGASAAFSVYTWVAIRLIRRGTTPMRLLAAATTVLICLWMKSTAYLALPLSLPVILFTVFRGNRQRWAWRVLVIGALVAVMATITWGDAATWYRATSQSIPARVRHPQAPFGNHAFQVDTTADVTPPWLAPLTQPLPTEQVQSLRGQTLTLGVWMWASAPLQARTPTIDVGGQLYFREIPVDTEPRFYALTATLTDEATRAWVSLAPALVAQETNAHVYYDGLVLAVGKRPSDEPPVFEDMAARKGSWGGLPFENLLRNPSAEEAGPRVRLGLDDLGAKILPDQTRPSMILTSLLDPAGAGWYYTLTAQNILRTFWAKFGWGHVPLPGGKPYRVLAGVTLGGLFGAVLGLWRLRRRLSWDVVLWLGLAVCGVWGAVLLRSVTHLFVQHPFIPVARYGFPAIVPTLLALNLGWYEIMRAVAKPLRAPLMLLLTIPVGFFLALDGFALLSILTYYFQ